MTISTLTAPALTAEELLAWNEVTWKNWHKLLTAHPVILAMPCDVLDVTNAAGLLQHIAAVELRYAERLAGLPASDYATIPCDSADALYATHAKALTLFHGQLASLVDWNEQIEFVTRSMGPARSARKTILFHALLHTVRHYAQLATLVRQHGVKPDWPMDYLFMDIKRV